MDRSEARDDRRNANSNTLSEERRLRMDRFSKKRILALGEYYVYGLIYPRNRQIFYIGKGTGQRVFEHERESKRSPDSESSN